MKKIKPEQFEDPMFREKLSEVIREYMAMGLESEQIVRLLGLPSSEEFMNFKMKKILKKVFGKS